MVNNDVVVVGTVVNSDVNEEFVDESLGVPPEAHVDVASSDSLSGTPRYGATKVNASAKNWPQTSSRVFTLISLTCGKEISTPSSRHRPISENEHTENDIIATTSQISLPG